MTIPGLKVLDEIIAGLPTNSAQRLEIARLKEQIASLQTENEQLKRLNASLEEKQDTDLVRQGDFYFKKGPDGAPTGNRYCLHCWESNKQLSSVAKVLGGIYRCSTCKNTFHR